MSGLGSKVINILNQFWSLLLTPIQNKVSPEQLKLYNIVHDYKHEFTSQEMSNLYEIFKVSNW